MAALTAYHTLPLTLPPLPHPQAHDLDDTTYVYDLGNTVRLYRAWAAALPRVVPYYAGEDVPGAGNRQWG